FAHWPAGAPFLKEPKEGHRPVMDGFLFVVKGEVNVRLSDGTQRNGVKAPALYHWNSAFGIAGPLGVKGIPAWARRGADPAGETAEALERFRKRLAKEGVSAYLPRALNDKAPLPRSLAVYAAAAVGDLPPVLG